METSLVVQWLKSGLPLQGAQVGSLVRKLDPTWYNETSHLLQQRQRIPCASSKTWGSQINKYPLLSPVRHTVFFFFQRYIYFFNVGHFLSLYWICYSTTSVLCFVFFFDGKACGILVPWPGNKSTPPALEGEVLTTGLPGKSLDTSSYKKKASQFCTN